MAKIHGVLKEYGISSIDECKEITPAQRASTCDKIVRGTQPICFENAVWAYTRRLLLSRMKKGCTKAADAAAAIGIGLAGVLHSGLCCREPQGWSRPRQPRRNASLGRDRMLLLPRRSRILRGSRGRDQDRTQRKQGAVTKPLRVYSERSRQGRGVYHFPYQRLHLLQRPSLIPTPRLVTVEQGNPVLERVRVQLSSATALTTCCEGVAIMKSGERRRFHHRQLHQPDPLPAPGCRHLQEVVRRKRREVFLGCFRRRHGPYPAPG